MLIKANPANKTRIVTARPGGQASAGQTCAKPSTTAEAMPAAANTAPSHTSTPTMKPTSGPNAASTYPAGPPLVGTRLPAAAKQRATDPMAIMQTR